MARKLLYLTVLLLMFTILSAGFCLAESDVGEKEATETVVTLKTNRGDIVLRFFPDVAPEHVKNFIEHGKSGLYKGCLFHRVIPGFMIQAGDPLSKEDDNPNNDGSGGYSYKGPGTKLKAEFNDRPHKRGTLSMARGGSPHTAGSQFFICHVDLRSLDGKYTVFGEVIDGIDVVDKIANTKTLRQPEDHPVRDQIIEDVLIEEWPSKKVEETLAAMKAEDPGPRGRKK